MSRLHGVLDQIDQSAAQAKGMVGADDPLRALEGAISGLQALAEAVVRILRWARLR